MYIVQQMYEGDVERCWIATTEEGAKEKAWAHFDDGYRDDEWIAEVLGGNTREDLERRWNETVQQWGQANLTCEEGHGIVVHVDVEVVDG